MTATVMMTLAMTMTLVMTIKCLEIYRTARHPVTTTYRHPAL
jgi:hypothetical protein